MKVSAVLSNGNPVSLPEKRCAQAKLRNKIKRKGAPVKSAGHVVHSLVPNLMQGLSSSSPFALKFNGTVSDLKLYTRFDFKVTGKAFIKPTISHILKIYFQFLIFQEIWIQVWATHHPINYMACVSKTPIKIWLKQNVMSSVSLMHFLSAHNFSPMSYHIWNRLHV